MSNELHHFLKLSFAELEERWSKLARIWRSGGPRKSLFIQSIQSLNRIFSARVRYSD